MNKLPIPIIVVKGDEVPTKEAIVVEVKPVTEPSPYRRAQIVGVFYNPPVSSRLDYKLVNRFDADIKAEVGTYNPYPATWERPKCSDKWSKMNRFPPSKEIILGPGAYSPKLPSSKPLTQSPFKSATKRFVELKKEEGQIHIEVQELLISGTSYYQ